MLVYLAPVEAMLCQLVSVSGHVTHHSVTHHAGIALLLGDFSEPGAIEAREDFQAITLVGADGASVTQKRYLAAQ